MIVYVDERSLRRKKPWIHLDFKHKASRTVRKYICAVQPTECYEVCYGSFWQKYITSYQRIYVHMLVYMCILGCAYVYKLIKKPMDDHYPHPQKLHSCLLTIIFFLWNIQEEIKGIKLKIKILYPEDTNILKSCILKCCNLFIWRQ